jgi:hypothetical protein
VTASKIHSLITFPFKQVIDVAFKAQQGTPRELASPKTLGFTGIKAKQQNIGLVI